MGFPTQILERVGAMVAALGLLMATLMGCAVGIETVGRIPNTEIDCHAVTHRDAFLATGMVVCVRAGEVKAFAGGAAPGIAGALGGVAQGIGSALGGVFVGEFAGQTLRSLSSPPGP